MIRSAIRAELEALARQDAEVFGEPYPFFVLRQFHDLDPDLLLVAEDEGELRGHAVAVRGEGDCFWILAIAVAATARGRGFGAALLDEVLSRAGAAGARRIRATAAPTNTASRTLLSSRGFREIASEPDWFGAGSPRLLLEVELDQKSADGPISGT